MYEVLGSPCLWVCGAGLSFITLYSCFFSQAATISTLLPNFSVFNTNTSFVKTFLCLLDLKNIKKTFIFKIKVYILCIVMYFI